MQRFGRKCPRPRLPLANWLTGWFQRSRGPRRTRTVQHPQQTQRSGRGSEPGGSSRSAPRGWGLRRLLLPASKGGGPAANAFPPVPSLQVPSG